MAFEHPFLDNHAHFVAGGRTLELIKQYEYDREHAEELYTAVAKEFGATSIAGGPHNALFISDKPLGYSWLTPAKEETDKDGTVFYQELKYDTPEGQAIEARLENIPKFALGFHIFAKRLTGEEQTVINPDNLQDPQADKPNPYYINPNYANTTYDAAIYRKYGDTYVVSVPLVLHGIFNDASKKEAEGYTFSWFNPPDSVQVPYSKVVEIRENALGDQTKPQVTQTPVGAFATRRSTMKMGG